MRIALAQINPTVGDLKGNSAKIQEYAFRAKHEGASIVLFPELSLCGYPPMDMLLKKSFVDENLRALDQLAQSVSGIALVVGFVDHNCGEGRPLFNACALLAEGKVVLKQYKTLLPSYDVFDEDRYFEPASQYRLATIENWKIGFSICEDIWNPQAEPKTRYHADPIEAIAALNPDLILNLSSSPFDEGKYAQREDLGRKHAKKHGMPLFYVNQVGGNDQLVFDGRSFVIDANGNLVARAAAFAEDLLITDFVSRFEIVGPIKDAIDAPIAEIYAALVLGTRDYLAKCGFTKAVIGLSGGIDSAVTGAIACEALGKDNLLGIAMPSDYSSAGSLTDAQALAANLGIRLSVVPISQLVHSFTDALAPNFQGLATDATEENIQARVRGTILMAMSNKLGAIVLTTGNKSELAVGYCTLYGDMCGGLAVISDVPKMKVYELAQYINTRAGRSLIPQSTIDKPPSAELKPNQTDQDSLPPYSVLDGIIRAYVEQRLNLEEITKLGYDMATVQDIIIRIDRNEYKRKQAAPGLKISRTAFGIGWRMPIAQRFD
jgi:NAD+ synthetase